MSILFAEISVGVLELLLLIVVGLIVPLAVWWTGRRWLLGYTGCLLIGVAITPADPLSALLASTLLAMLYTPSVIAWRAAGRTRSEPLS